MLRGILIAVPLILTIGCNGEVGQKLISVADVAPSPVKAQEPWVDPEPISEGTREAIYGEMMAGLIYDYIVEMTVGELMAVAERSRMHPDWLAGFNTSAHPWKYLEEMTPEQDERVLEAVKWVDARDLDQRIAARKLRYGCQLARTAVSENASVLWEVENGGTAGAPTEDVWSINQVAENTIPRDKYGDYKAEGTLLGLVRHAGHVNQLKMPKRHRQSVSKTLPCAGDDRPAVWIDSRDVDDPETDRNDGDWRAHGRYWTRFRDEVMSRVLAGRVPRPCPGHPIRWGNRDDICADRNSGFCVLDCGDANYFLARVGRGCELTPATNPAALCVEQKRGVGKEPIPASVAAGKQGT